MALFAAESREEVEAQHMTDKQWDELVESFEVVKYGAVQEGIKRRPEKDMQCSSGKCKPQASMGRRM